MPELGRWRLGPLARIRDLRRFHMASGGSYEGTEHGGGFEGDDCVRAEKSIQAGSFQQPTAEAAPSRYRPSPVADSSRIVQVVIRQEVGGPYHP
jgi:hypothetical protein